MERRLVSGLILASFLLSTLTLASNIHSAKAISIIKINSDGSVDPSTAPIHRNGSLYTFTDNIASDSDGIYIERGNMVLDGAGYALTGPGGCIGISFWGKSNVTIRNIEISHFWYGIEIAYSNGNRILGNTIELVGGNGIEVFSSSDNKVVRNRVTACYGDGVSVGYSSDNNSFLGNNITNNLHGFYVFSSSSNRISGNRIEGNSVEGIYLGESTGISIVGNRISDNGEGVLLSTTSDSVIVGNNITNNGIGAALAFSSNNVFYHNNFLGNWWSQVYSGSGNAWDDGYPSGGNYWSDYQGVDLDNDGIGDSPYVLNSQNIDRYPLMNQRPLSSYMYLDPSTAAFDVGSTFKVNVMVSWAQNLWAWQAGVQWDPTILQYVSFSWGDFQELAGMRQGSSPTISESAGRTSKPALESALRGGRALIGAADIRLLTLTFKAIGAGTSQLRLRDTSLIRQSPSETTTYPRWSDVNGNGQVDTDDVNFIVTSWKEGLYNQTADLNNDGKVDITDMSIATSDFGKTVSDSDWDVTNTVYAVPTEVTGMQITARPSSFCITSVPYHRQPNGYTCGPASLEMLFDFYGPDVSLLEISDVARTSPLGTYTVDMPRAAHFSNMSTSVGKGSPLNYTGYTSRKLGYAAFEAYSMTIDDLKSLILAGYPIIVLTTWHFRVVVGYDNEHITFQDPYFGPMYNMTYREFDMDWDYSNHWGLFVSPWQIQVSNIRNAVPGEIFQVSASVTYPWEPPFAKGQYTAIMPNATIMLPPGLTLVPGEIPTKSVSFSLGYPQDFGYIQAGDTVNVTWTLQAQTVGNYKFSVEAVGNVFGYTPDIPSGYPGYSYEDRIGGTAAGIVSVTSSLDESPPTTTDNYDGLWHSRNFRINLTAADDNSGLMETYYRLNNGPKKTLSTDGQPFITSEKANNTLEYWSTDWAGNVEAPHHFLSGIKLDKTEPIIGAPTLVPSADVQKNQEVKVSVNAVDTVSGVKNVTLYYTVDGGISGQSLTLNYNPFADLYEGMIPGQPAGAVVKFKTVAYDNAGNMVLDNNYGRLYAYEVPRAQATVHFAVDTLNLETKGDWIVAYIELPGDYNVTNVDVSSIRLNGTVLVDPHAPVFVGDCDSDGVQDLTVFFNRTVVSGFIISRGKTTGNVSLTVTGRLVDGTVFEGTDVMRVRMQGDTNVDGRVDVKDLALAAQSFGAYLNGPGWNRLADENEDGQVDIRDLVLIAKNFGKIYV